MDELNDSEAAAATADITFDAAGVPIIKLRGEIDMSNVDSLRATIEPVAARAPGRVVFDLSALEFMDSSGIALLVQVAAKTESVQVLRPSALVRRIIEATGLAGVLSIDS